MVRMVSFKRALSAVAATAVMSGSEVSAQGSNMRIVGGGETDGIKDTPWVTSLQVEHRSGFKHICGGTLVHERYILTAGHCVSPGAPFRGRVVIGQYNIAGEPETGSQIIKSSNVHMLPSYNFIMDDIALVELAQPVKNVRVLKWNENYNNKMEKPGEKLETFGWGYIDQDIPHSEDKLGRVEVLLVAQKECSNAYNKIADSVICTEYKIKGRDLCAGDSGGPLLYTDSKGVQTQVGIVSYRDGCAQAEKYGMHTRLSKHSDWIRGIVGEIPDDGNNTIPSPSPTPNPSPSPTPNPTKQPTPNPTKEPTPAPVMQPAGNPGDSQEDYNYGCYRYNGNPGFLKDKKECVLPFTYFAPDGTIRTYFYAPTIKEAEPFGLDMLKLVQSGNDKTRWCPNGVTYNMYNGKSSQKMKWGVAVCRRPAGIPTVHPTQAPTPPTQRPTRNPTLKPTEEATPSPTLSPTQEPTPSPTASPTLKPTTSHPTLSPTQAPTTLDFALVDLMCRSKGNLRKCALNDWNQGTCDWDEQERQCHAISASKSPTSAPVPFNRDTARYSQGHVNSNVGTTTITVAIAAVGIVAIGAMMGAFIIVRKKRHQSRHGAKLASKNNMQLTVAGPKGGSFHHANNLFAMSAGHGPPSPTFSRFT